MRELIGEEKFAQLRAYEQIEPGLRRADEIIAHLRDARVDLGETEAGIRELAAATAFATDVISRRIYQQSPLTEIEERQLVARARSNFAPLRTALSATGDERAIAALDAWIDRRIAVDLALTKQLLPHGRP